MKKHTFWIVVLLLFLTVGGTVSVFYFQNGTEPSKMAVISHKDLEGQQQIVEEPCPQPVVECLATTGESTKPLSIQEEIAILNDPDAIPFLNPFHDGRTIPLQSPKITSSKTKLGYQVKMNVGSFLTTPTYSDGVLYTSGGFTSREFYALNAISGKVIWAVDLSDDGPSSALVLDSTVIFNTESCTIFALDKFSGEQIWAKWIGDPLLSHPVSDGKLVFTAYPKLMNEPTSAKAEQLKKLAPSHPFAALDVKTGAVKWQRWLDGDVMTTPVLCGNEIYLTTFTGTIYRLEAKTGKILKASTLQATSLPTIAGNSIYTTKRLQVKGKVSEAIVELDKRSLRIKRTLLVREAPYLDSKVQALSLLKDQSSEWDAANGFFFTPDVSGYQKAETLVGQSNISSLQNFVGSTVVVDSMYMYSCLGDLVVCLDVRSGGMVWSYLIPGNLKLEGGHLATIPMVLDRYLVTSTLEGEILIINKLDGLLRKSYPTETEVRNQPIVVNGRVYVTSTDGQITCVDTKNRKLDGWPMFLKNNAHNCELGSNP